MYEEIEAGEPTLKELDRLRHRLVEYEESETRRERVDRAIRLSERYFRSLVENSLDIITILDNEGTLAYCSPSFKRVLGYEEDELLGRNALEFIHPDDLPAVADSLSRIARHPDSRISVEYRFRHKDGSWLFLEGTGLGIFEASELGGVIFNSCEITNRKQVEGELQRGKQYYKSLIRNAPDAVIVLSADFIIQWGSPAGGRLTGYGPDDVHGKSVFNFIHPDDIEKAKEAYVFAVQNPGLTKFVEYRYRHKNGSYQDHEVIIHSLLDDPDVRSIVSNSRDVTERKLMEENLREHRERLAELVGERTRELKEANKRLQEEIVTHERLEELLQKREEYFRSLIENSYDVIVVLDRAGTIDYISSSAREVFGYEPEELAGEGAQNYIHPDDMPGILKAIEEGFYEPGYTGFEEFRWRHKNGSWRLVEAAGTNLLDNLAVAGAVVHFRDITERRRMEEELKSSEERFRFLIENSLDIISILDKDGMITYTSPSIENVLGYTPDDMKRSVVDFLHPDDLEKVAQDTKSLLREPERILNTELRVRNKYGQYRDIEIVAKNLLDNPSVRGIVANYRDVTERKMIRGRLEKINHLFLSMGVDLIANMEKIIETGRDVLGVPFAAYSRIEKGNLSTLSTASGADSLTITSKPNDYLSYEIISAGGKEPWIIGDIELSPYKDRDPILKKYGFKSFLGYPVRGSEGNIGCLYICDSSERIFTHEQAEILGMLGRALSVEEDRLAHEQGLKDFIDVASHELRHPITLMKGYALTLRDYGDRLADDARRDYLNIIGQGADRLDMLIKELLDVSRIERGRFPLNRREVRLEPLVERAVGEMRSKGIPTRFVVSIPSELQTRSVDPEKMVRVLVVLLDNAYVHNPENSEVELVAENQGTEVIISVLDHGIGVPEKDRERIFERFYQVEDALHHSAPGMGLGLYIAKEIVETHGGRIWYEPREGGGSIFRCTLL